MRASAVVLLYCALALTATRPDTHRLHSFLAPTVQSAHTAKAHLPAHDVADTGPEACTPVSGPRFQPSNAVDRAEPFGGRASVALRGAFDAVRFEAPTAADLPVRVGKTVALVDEPLHASDRTPRYTDSEVMSVNRRWLVYASTLALRRAGLLSARSTSPAPPVLPQL